MSTLSTFPLELLKLIATLLPSIKDVLSFASISRCFHAAVHSDQQVFRSHFLRIYEPPRGKQSGYDYKTAFKRRHQPGDEEVLDMILDARPTRFGLLSPVISRNLELIHRRNLELPPPLQILLYPLRFIPPKLPIINDNRLAKLQNIAYHPNVLRKFCPPTYDAPLMEIAELFQHQLDTRRHGAFYQANFMHRYEFPSFWSGKTLPEHAGAEIPARWFGAYLYIPFAVHIIGEEPFVLSEETGDDYLSEILLTSPEKFEGRGKDFNAFTLKEGNITTQGVAGPNVTGLEGEWKWVSFLKDYGSYQWRYDGVMFPGNTIVLGVWRSPEVEPDMAVGSRYGIFMLWAVPEGGLGLGWRDNRLSLRG
ncbi:hypothetical protein BDD12DRAFT_149351 [Trichophaea hybrida]|nr:hypothetical protein BDD12DRAFT_149351 [Trichophaea hybrida]